MITYVPRPGELRVLLDLADDPRHDVATTTDTEGFGVVIPEKLFERLQQYKSLSPKEPRKKKESS